MNVAKPKQTAFATRLKAARNARGLKQKKVAKDFNIHIATYVNYETGKTEPSLTMLRDIAVYYNVSADYLLGLKNAEEEELFLQNLNIIYKPL